MDKKRTGKNLLRISKNLMIIVIISQIIWNILQGILYSVAIGGTPIIYSQILFVLGSLSSLLFYAVILILIVYFIQKEH